MKRLFCFLTVAALALGSMAACQSNPPASPDPLQVPTGLAAVDVTYETAILKWEHPDADKHEVIVNGGEPVAVIGLILKLDDLTPKTNYTWKVRSGRGDVWSEWVDGPGFDTTAVPLVSDPSYLTTFGTTLFSVVLMWQHPDAGKHEVVLGDREPIVVTQMINEMWICQVKDLTPQTTYTWKVRSSKGDVWSEWVDGPEFSTPSMSVLPDESDMVLVQGGTFMMGSDAEYASPSESPVHQVTLSDFYISKYEITQVQWLAIMGSNTSYIKGDDHPVEGVYYEEAEDFVKRLSAATGQKYVLPTEAQWEFAARGGNESKNYKYAGSDDIDQVGWYYDNCAYGHVPIGGKLPNELGLYDMTGSVWEWCSDWFGDYPDSAQTDPTGPQSGPAHVLRGCGWSTQLKDCHLTYRLLMDPTQRGGASGIRLVRLP